MMAKYMYGKFYPKYAENTSTTTIKSMPSDKWVTDVGDISDGYHTYNELYDHRAKLFACLCTLNKDRAWKSKLHDDGSMYEGMFIVGIETDMGQATYHYNIEPYWNIFDVEELKNAPKFDGHTPDDAINRILKQFTGVGE